MKTIITCGAALLCTPAAAVTITFEDLNPTQAYSGPGGGFFENGLNDDPSFQSGPLTFGTDFNPDFGGFWSGWAYSNTLDTLTEDIANQYSAFPGIGGEGSSTYAIGSRFGGSISLDIPANFDLASLQLASTTWSSQYILNQNTLFGNDGRAFGGNPAITDLLRIQIAGTLAGVAVGSPIEVDLANSSATTDFGIQNDWLDVDLTSLETADNLQFTIINTQGGVPSYFALDNIELIAVPEPSSALLGLLSLGLLGLRRR